MARKTAWPALALLASLLAACPRPAEKWDPEERVTYGSGGETLRGFLVRDETLPGRRPGVLVAHDWWGQDEYARRRARMLADLGYVAFALDLFGEGRQAGSPDEAMKMASEVLADPVAAVARFRAGYEWLRAHEACDPARIAAIGYGFGGTMVIHAARAGLPLSGVVSFHGNLRLAAGAPEGPVTAKILVCHGVSDMFVPVEEVEGLRTALAGTAADLRVIEYPGAQHSFTVPEANVIAKKWRLPVAYFPSMDRKSWQDMKDFLAEVLR
ncbi:MAG: dienelactone hydrolase family protein [Planctomycetes bacterium]|jgi:dienelactone hydrolase|nr:dienelactone hydrolase family protein [Planctomycetota bacterium]